MNYFEIIGRAAAAFFVLLLLTRLMGRKQISQLTFFNYVTGISIGAIAGSVSIDPGIKLLSGVASLATWSALTLVFGVLDIKFKAVRELIDGSPVIVVKQGKIMERQLKKLRLDMDQLKQLLRGKDVFSLSDVEYAIMETSGQLSVLLKETKKPVMKEDVNFPPKNEGKQQPYPIPVQIISDGKILENHLYDLNLSKGWVEEQLKKSGTPLDEVFYAEVQKDGSLYIDKRSDLFLH